jgi:hypothetical protein
MALSRLTNPPKNPITIVGELACSPLVFAAAASFRLKFCWTAFASLLVASPAMVSTAAAGPAAVSPAPVKMSPQLTPLHTRLAQTDQHTLGIEKKLTRLNLCRIILLGEMTSASNRLRRTSRLQSGHHPGEL